MIWNESFAAPAFTDLIDGRGGYGHDGENQGGWIRLAQFDTDLARAYRVFAGDVLEHNSNMRQIKLRLRANAYRLGIYP